MKKNGKSIKCKTYKKEFYISGSRIGVKKYCSFECARKDNFGFKKRLLKCKICGKEFVIDNQLRLQDKTCSYECRKENGRIHAIKQREKKKHIIVKRQCKVCGKEIISTAYCPVNFCGGKYGECFKKYYSERRKGKNNPAYRNGFAMKRSKTYGGKHLRSCAKYKKEFLKKHDYMFCELCKVNATGTLRFEVHHIYWASRYPKHKELHNFKNLILLCVKCHNDFHANRLNDKFEIIERVRGLKELFKK